MLRRARLDAGLTQAQLAERAGTSQPAVNRYERGEELPTIPTLERLLDACGRQLSMQSAPRRRRSRPSSVRSANGPLATRLRAKRPLLLAAARRRGVYGVRVFGSIARQEEATTSDVDLLVQLKPGRTLVDLAGFRRDATEILGVGVDVATPDMLKERVRGTAMREALPL